MTQVASLRERKRQQTRIDLVRAAVELFQEQGYEATTVDQIVELGNYSKSTFFRYFGGKEDVVFLDMPERVAGVAQSLAGADPGVDIWATVRQYATTSLLEFLSHDSDVYAQCIPLWFSDPALWRRYAELMLQSETSYAEFIASSIGAPLDDVGCAVLA
ncbi:MAG TPA: TetR family transcriptional regulator, partial [Acidimicrobiales bacterium]